MVIKIHDPFGNHSEGLFVKITKEVNVAHDWLVGAPMSQRDRVSHALVEAERWRYDGPLGY